MLVGLGLHVHLALHEYEQVRLIAHLAFGLELDAGLFELLLFGFLVLIGGLLAALWKLGILERIGTAWTLIGVAILIGIGIMISVTNSGRKDNIEIDSK